MRSREQQYSTTRRYILAFCDLFTDLYVVRYMAPEEGHEWKYEKVPVMFPFTEKWFAYQKTKWGARADMNDNYLFEISKTLPMISIGEFKLSRNLDKQHNKQEQMFTDDGSLIATPVAYTLDTNISIYTNLLDDNYQLVEQILPYFAPSYNVNVNIPEISLNESVPVYLDGVSETYPVEMDDSTKRLIVTELSFHIDVNYYPDKIEDNDAYTKEIIVE